MNRVDIIEKCSNAFEYFVDKANTGTGRILNFCYESKGYRAVMSCFLLVVIAVGIYILNQHTVLIVDDYGYSYSTATGERIASLKDIFESQYRHYFTWGGRSIVHCLAQFFLMYDKWVFNIANTIAYVLLLMVMYIHILGKLVWMPGLIVLLNIGLFAFAPAFGQDFLWVVGACNYLWGPLLSFSYLLAFRFQMDQEDPIINNVLLSVIYGLLGIICAWTNENVAVTMVLLAIFFNGYIYLSRGSCYRWSIFATLGIVVGATVLISAPGNYVRLATFSEVSYIHNFTSITRQFFAHDYLLVPVALSFMFCIVRKDRCPGIELIFYVLGLLLSMYAMVGAPFYADRAKIGSLIFALIILGKLWTEMELTCRKGQQIWAIALIVLLLFTGRIYEVARKDIVAYEKRDIAKVELVVKEKAKGNLDPVIQTNEPRTQHCAAWGLEDISDDPEHWTNVGFARYYGLRTVRTEAVKDEE